MFWADFAPAMMWCTSRGLSCGGLTFQDGRYEARRAVTLTTEAGKEGKEAPRSYLKPSLPGCSTPQEKEDKGVMTCSWVRIKGAILKESPEGHEDAIYSTLGAAQEECQRLGRRCGGISEAAAGSAGPFRLHAGRTPTLEAGFKVRGAAAVHLRLCVGPRISTVHRCCRTPSAGRCDYTTGKNNVDKHQCWCAAHFFSNRTY